MSFSLRSPAKINLFLRVLFKRADGYHELASLFQAVDLCDTLHIEKAESDRLTCTDPALSCDSDNFVSRAVELFRRETGVQEHFRIHLEKKIPQEAGLGGGSSNCATTFYALNQLCGQRVPEERLKEWAGRISTDAPFFFSSGTAYYRGIGERLDSLDPLPFLAGKKIAIIKPTEGLSTKEIFSRLDLKQCSQRLPQELLDSFLEGRPSFVNDLEGAAYALSPRLKKLREELHFQGFKGLFMTGSGSAHVALIEDQIPPYLASNANFTSFIAFPIHRKVAWY